MFAGYQSYTGQHLKQAKELEKQRNIDKIREIFMSKAKGSEDGASLFANVHGLLTKFEISKLLSYYEEQGMQAYLGSKLNEAGETVSLTVHVEFPQGAEENYVLRSGFKRK